MLYKNYLSTNKIENVVGTLIFINIAIHFKSKFKFESLVSYYITIKFKMY